jgi:hypothetical protein
MENDVPFAGALAVLWIGLVLITGLVMRRALFAFFFGVLFTGAYIAYCSYYAGIPEMGGFPQALAGGVYAIAVFYVVREGRDRLRRRRESQHSEKKG